MKRNDTPNLSAAENWELTLRVHDGAGDIRCLAGDWVTTDKAKAIGKVVREMLAEREEATT